MIGKAAVMQAIVEPGALLIVRLDDADRAIEVARDAIAGGFRAVEITLSVPRALEVIRTLSGEFSDRGVAIGAGTVLDAESAFTCIGAGASLLVSPNLDAGMIRVANRYQVTTVSGALTPTEIVDTMAAGADFVKLFPTEIAGPVYAKTVLTPLPQTPLVPAGGVTVDNAGDWIAAGCIALGVGSSVTKAPRGGVRAAAAAILEAIATARSRLATLPPRA